MPPLDTSEDRKPSATLPGPSFWAIRKCDSLQSPAIFLNWDDCSFYVDQSDNDCEVDFKQFKDAYEALTYILPPGVIADLPVARAASATTSPVSKFAASAASGKTTRSTAARKRKDVSDEDSDTSPSNKRTRYSPNETWEANYQIFLDYKEEFGDPVLSPERIKTNDKYRVLDSWKTPERTRLRDYLRDSNAMLDADRAKARRLIQANFLLKAPTAKAIETWENRYSQAKAYHDIHGTIQMSRKQQDLDTGLQTWIYLQKEELRKFDDPTEYSKLIPDAANRLRAIGIGGKQRRQERNIPPELREIYATKLKEQLELRYTVAPPNQALPGAETSTVDQATATTTPTAATVVPAAGAAAESKEATSDDAAVPSDQLTKTDRRWEENFQRLKDYKARFGTCDLIKKTTEEEHLKTLPTFVRYERGRIQRIQEMEKTNPDDVPEKEKTKVQRLLDLGFVMEPGSEAREQARKLFGENSIYGRDKRAPMWEANFELLKQYKERNGTSKLSKSNELWSPHLETWVRYQITQLRAYEGTNGRKCTLSEDRVKRLKELDFEWALTPVPPKQIPGTWDEMFEELKEFKARHGHTLVPSQPRTALRNWVINQREHYDKMKAGKKTEMNNEKLEKLLNLGLQMQPNVRKSFEERAAEWLEYRTKHGRDPPGDTTPVGKWARKTRSKWAMKQQGVETNLTDKQIEQLTSWGFKWDSGMKKPDYISPKKRWEDRFQELLAYKREHGDVNVPQLYPVLGNWVHRQRREFSELKRGKKSAITPEKIELLRSVGFVFLTRKSRLESEKKKREIELGLVEADRPNEDDDSSIDDREVNMASYRFW